MILKNLLKDVELWTAVQVQSWANNKLVFDCCTDDLTTEELELLHCCKITCIRPTKGEGDALELIAEIDVENLIFLSDPEKMRDFRELSKEEFLFSYSYLTELEYDTTASLARGRRGGIIRTVKTREV